MVGSLELVGVAGGLVANGLVGPLDPGSLPFGEARLACFVAAGDRGGCKRIEYVFK